MNKLTEQQIKKIYQRVHIKGNELVLIDISDRKDISMEENNANIYFLNQNSEIIWQIKAKNTAFDRDMFTSMEFNLQGELIASRFSGFEYVVDLETGIAKVSGWSK